MILKCNCGKSYILAGLGILANIVHLKVHFANPHNKLSEQKLGSLWETMATVYVIY